MFDEVLCSSFKYEELSLDYIILERAKEPSLLVIDDIETCLVSVLKKTMGPFDSFYFYFYLL